MKELKNGKQPHFIFSFFNPFVFSGGNFAESVGRLEFLQEACIVFREKAEVVDAIFQVGDTLYTHTEGISAVYFAVNAVQLQYVRVNHPAAQDFNPTCTFTEWASLAAADVAADVHFGAGLCKGEVGGTQADFGIIAEHFLGKEQQGLF